MKSFDCLFNSFLDYITHYNLGHEPGLEEYSSERPYFALWKKGLEQIKEGVCPSAMQASLEYEKLKFLLNGAISEDELMELVLMEKLMYSLYSGNLSEIANLVQNFSSQGMRTKYAKLIEQLVCMEEEQIPTENYKSDGRMATVVPESETSTPVENLNREDEFEDFFTALHACMRNALDIQKIEIVIRMIEEQISSEHIKRAASIDDDYIHIIEAGVKKDSDVYEIYYELIQTGCISIDAIKPLEYRNLDFNDSRLYQIAIDYWNRFNQ